MCTLPFVINTLLCDPAAADAADALAAAAITSHTSLCRRPPPWMPTSTANNLPESTADESAPARKRASTPELLSENSGSLLKLC